MSCARSSRGVELDRAGAGEPLVLIHGVGHHRQAWRPVAERLAGSFELIAVDSPGFGRSEALPADVEPTIHAYADAYEVLFDELGLERPHVAGNSMGGAIALELARRRSARSATAISPAGLWTARERRFCQLSLGAIAALPPAVRPHLVALAGSPAGRAALFGQIFARPWLMPADEARATLRDFWASPALAPALAAFDRYTLTDPEGLRAAGVPLTIAWGTRDRLLIHARQFPRARRLLPWARCVELRGLGHTPFHDDPDMVAAVVRAGARAASPGL